jgi:hypothetical protein
MRDLLNLLYPVITESRGLGARRPGEEFVSTTEPDDRIYVNSVSFYPQGATEYPSYEEMAAALKEIAHSIPNATVDLIGKFKQTDRAFGVAVFDRPDGGRLAFVKPFRAIKLDPTQNGWDNQAGIPGYRYNSKSAAKAQAGLTPQDILTQQSDLTPQDIIDQVAAKFGADSPLVEVGNAIAAGQQLPITIPVIEGMSFTAFRDYFCELMHPIALQTGVYTGNAGEAAMKFLAQDGFEGTSINFGTDKTEGLSDSILIAPDGKKIKVSSKGGAGAQASAKNLLDAANELEGANSKLAKKHADIIELMHQIVQAGQAGAPLVLGVKYGIIGAKDASDIQEFKKLPPTTLAAAQEMGISKKLKALIAERKTDNPNNVNLFFHSIAAVAHKAAEHVNENTNFSNAASEILNNGALVQVYTKATEKGGEWVLQDFHTVWPSSAVTGVKFSAGKTYYSTGIKGNFTFKILKGGAKDKEDEIDDVDAMSPDIEAPSVVTGKRVSIRPPGAPRTAPSAGIGRERR